jgi:3-methyladenine DNA glycosylase AlkD/adenylate kinase family enzyme
MEMGKKMSEIEKIRVELVSLGDKERAENSKRYLKSQYSFYGVRVPELRRIAKNYKNIDIYDAYNLFDELWKSGNHEEMNLGIFILGLQKKKFNLETWKFIMQRLERAKSWDHIDIISSSILGEILANNLGLIGEVKQMAESRNPWIRRTSIISTCRLISKNKLELTMRLAEKLVYDEDIYVQKGAGWMLRELGKKDRMLLREFILAHRNMKSFSLSYATEKMPELRKIVREMKSKAKLIILRGPAAVGKTTIAREIAERIKGEYISIDGILEKYGLDQAEEGKGIGEQNFLKANQIVLPLIKEKIKSGSNVVIDGNFYHISQLEDFAKKIPSCLVFTLNADVEECLKRDKTRKAIGEDAVRAVHNLVSRFDHGEVINTENKTSEEVVEEIISKLKNERDI